jgi:hypothetical protein
MKRKLFTTAFAIVALSTVVSQAQLINSFVNANFDSGATTSASGVFKGFDAPTATEIIGWQNYGTVTDAGVEASGAWWIQGYAYGNCAFVNAGGGAYNLSSYVIQAGDVFTPSIVADAWGSGAITATLFYNDPANVIGTYTFTPNAWHFDVWTDTAGIAATGASVGGTLGIIIANTGGASNVGFDQIAVNVTPVPEPATISLLAVAGGGMLLMRRRLVK